MYVYGRYINSNLGCGICSTHSNLILINFGYVAGLYLPPVHVSSIIDMRSIHQKWPIIVGNDSIEVD